MYRFSFSFNMHTYTTYIQAYDMKVKKKINKKINKHTILTMAYICMYIHTYVNIQSFSAL